MFRIAQHCSNKSLGRGGLPLHRHWLSGHKRREKPQGQLKGTVPREIYWAPLRGKSHKIEGY